MTDPGYGADAHEFATTLTRLSESSERATISSTQYGAPMSLRNLRIVLYSA